MREIYADAVSLSYEHNDMTVWGSNWRIPSQRVTATVEVFIPADLVSDHIVAIRHISNRSPRTLIAFDGRQTSVSFNDDNVCATYESTDDIYVIAPFEGDDVEGAVADARRTLLLQRQQEEADRTQREAARIRQELADKAERIAQAAALLAASDDPFELDSDLPAQAVMVANDNDWEADLYDDWDD